MNHVCPVCAYSGLEEPPRGQSGGGSYEVCPCCGFQFGVSDDDDGLTYEVWREHWVAEGMLWFSRGVPAPAGWDARAQFATLSGKPPVKPPTKPTNPSGSPDGTGPRRPR